MFAQLGPEAVITHDTGIYHFRGGHRLWVAPEVPEVTYASDRSRQSIPWVRYTDASGQVTEYKNELWDAADPGDFETRTMDCIDCHNRPTHIYEPPDRAVDQAMLAHRVSRNLPWMKQQAVTVLSKDYATTEEALRTIENDLRTYYTTEYPDVAAARKAELDASIQHLKQVFQTIRFPEMKTDWRTHPNNVGHFYSPGCFRCHDGKHLDSAGQAVRLQCTLCHALPQVVREDGARSVVSTVNPDLTPPPTHQEPNFMHDHRTKLDDSCQMCHGKIQFGTEGGSFCSNPACHGRKWPEMSLDAQAGAESFGSGLLAALAGFTSPTSAVPVPFLLSLLWTLAVSLRVAAYMIGISRVVQATKLRGYV